MSLTESGFEIDHKECVHDFIVVNLSNGAKYCQKCKVFFKKDGERI